MPNFFNNVLIFSIYFKQKLDSVFVMYYSFYYTKASFQNYKSPKLRLGENIQNLDFFQLIEDRIKRIFAMFRLFHLKLIIHLRSWYNPLDLI